MRFPRTFKGWAKLFWLAIYRCPVCHGPLQQNWPLHKRGDELWCLACGGVQLPRGFFNALRWNRRDEPAGRGGVAKKLAGLVDLLSWILMVFAFSYFFAALVVSGPKIAEVVAR
jgi:hypothetical protein